MTTKRPAPRIITFDLMRGFYLAIIIVDHMGKFPSLFDLVTGEGLLWASAAEGFFFLSGIMIGLVRGKLMRANQLRLAWEKVWKRAAQLYLWSVGLTLGFTYWAQATNFRDGVKGGFFTHTGVWDTISQALLLHYSYGWTDYLSHYAVFLFWAPLALYLLRRTAWWTVPALSLGLWLLRGTNFNLGWQLLFFWGVTIGYHYEAIHRWMHRCANDARQRFQLAISALAVGSFLVSELQLRDYLPASESAVTHLFDKLTLGPGRVVVFFTWFLALYLFTERFEPQLLRRIGRIFIPLGQQSLFVFIVSGTLIFGLDFILPNDSYGLAWNLLIVSTVLAFMWLCAYAAQQRQFHMLFTSSN